MVKTKKLPIRAKVKVADTWDLTSLYFNDAAWEKAFAAWGKSIAGFEQFRGKLGNDAKTLLACLKFDTELDRVGERLGTYAYLKATEDVGNGTYQGMKSRYLGAASRAAQAASFIRPEILSIAAAKMKKFLADPLLADFKLAVERIARYKPHTLAESEERLLAMQTEMAATSNQVFGQLNNVDLKFGNIAVPDGGEVELSHAFFSTCLHHPDRDLRQRAFHQYYNEYADHCNTLAATLNGSVQRDIYNARARNFPSALEASLFDDNVPPTVYDNLISTVRKRLPALHEYYEVRRKAMKIKKLHHYDTYVPMVADLQPKRSWNQAVKCVVESLAPLGAAYCKTLEAGLSGRWCDKYENKGKQSGAFSSGAYGTDPYILMNYQPEVIDHTFTLAHETGHSMHTYFSAKSQPYQYYQYTIFVAEVASTFNEQLLSQHLFESAQSNEEKAFYINREIDAIRATLFRQTMFAEFEKITHALAEANEPLTLDRFRSEYRKLLNAYFGPQFGIDDELSLECLRIPHFYRAFYVYKYATGLSAAIALATKVSERQAGALDAYLGFLSAGCSKFPLDLLVDAGVDMRTPAPVEAAMDRFESLVGQLRKLLL